MKRRRKLIKHTPSIMRWELPKATGTGKDVRGKWGWRLWKHTAGKNCQEVLETVQTESI